MNAGTCHMCVVYMYVVRGTFYLSNLYYRYFVVVVLLWRIT